MKTVEDLRNLSEEDILNFIRESLSFDKSLESQLRHIDKSEFKKEHYRFEMSGDNDDTGENVIHNQFVLNKFAYLGIYNYVSYLHLHFYEGHPTLYIKYYLEDKNLDFDLAGYTTSEIIYKIFKLTILSDK